MSLQVEIGWYERGRTSGVSLPAVRGAFGMAATGEDGAILRVAWGPEERAEVWLPRHDDDPDLAVALVVDRPCRHIGLWNTLFELLQVGNAALHFPGGGPILARPEASAHLPHDLREALGPGFVAMSPEHLRELVGSA